MIVRYGIQAITDKATTLRNIQESYASLSTTEDIALYDSPPFMNTNLDIRSKLLVPGTGCFVMYSNGAVHVEFEDGACVDLEGIGVTSQFSNGRFVYTAHGASEQGRIRNGVCLGTQSDEVKM